MNWRVTHLEDVRQTNRTLLENARLTGALVFAAAGGLSKPEVVRMFFGETPARKDAVRIARRLRDLAESGEVDTKRVRNTTRYVLDVDTATDDWHNGTKIQNAFWDEHLAYDSDEHNIGTPSERASGRWRKWIDDCRIVDDERRRLWDICKANHEDGCKRCPGAHTNDTSGL